MYVDPVNPIIKKTLSEYLQKELEFGEQSFDFDDTVYTVAGDPENEKVWFQFKCNNAEVIMENGGMEMLEQEYAQFMCPRDQWVPDWDVTLVISTSDLPKTQKVKRSMTEAEQEAIRQSNEAVRAERQVKVDEIATKFAKFKRDFIGAPIRRALLQMRDKAAVSNCEIPYRKDEKYWIVSNAAGQASFYFSFNFKNATDISMGRIVLLEFKDAVRHVKGAIATAYHDKQNPAELAAVYSHTARETYTNGIIEFSKYLVLKVSSFVNTNRTFCLC